jgi:thiol-disulfide isomerase/thioredoxin
MKTLSLFAILFFFSVSITAQQIARSADDILADSYKEAAASNKNVLLLFHASWCGWCHKLDNSLNDSSCKKFFDDNYVIVHLTVAESDDNKPLENPGAVDIIQKYNAMDAGLPFWLILNKNGNLLADSRMRPKGATLDYPGDNMGCPSTEEEVTAFIKILKQTSTLTGKELKIIADRFKKNKE